MKEFAYAPAHRKFFHAFFISIGKMAAEATALRRRSPACRTL